MDSEEEYNKSLETKQILNKIVMESLIDKPLVPVAMSFSTESGCPLDVDVAYIENQQKVKDFIMSKKFDDAIKFLEELGMDSDSHPLLVFELEKNKLMDLLENQDLEEAIKFSEHFVRWDNDEAFKELCRQTLLLFLEAHEPETSIAAQVLRQTRISHLATLASTTIQDHYKHYTDSILHKAKTYRAEEKLSP